MYSLQDLNIVNLILEAKAIITVTLKLIKARREKQMGLEKKVETAKPEE